MSESQECVIGYFGDRHGRPAAAGTDHLTDEQREELPRRAEELARRRGRLEAVIGVDVYDTGEAGPQVQFPKASTIDMCDKAPLNAAVAKAAEALRNWS
jgi:hypothetical protein